MTRTPKVGDIILVTGNSESANYKIGEKYRVTRVECKTLEAESLDGKWQGNWLNHFDCKLSGINRDYFEKNIAERQRLIDEDKAIIAWMDEVGADEYDENEFKVWQALTTIESGTMSKLDKVKAIAALLNN